MIAPEAFDWVASLPLTSIQKHILLVMICRGNGRRTAWPSQERLAAECSTSVATVKRTIKELVRLGYLTPLVDPERSARLAAAGISYPVFTVVYAVNLSLQEGEGVAHHELGGVAHHELQSTETLSTTVPTSESPKKESPTSRRSQNDLFPQPKPVRPQKPKLDPDKDVFQAGVRIMVDLAEWTQDEARKTIGAGFKRAARQQEPVWRAIRRCQDATETVGNWRGFFFAVLLDELHPERRRDDTPGVIWNADGTGYNYGFV